MESTQEEKKWHNVKIHILKGAAYVRLSEESFHDILHHPPTPEFQGPYPDRPDRSLGAVGPTCRPHGARLGTDVIGWCTCHHHDL